MKTLTQILTGISLFVSFYSTAQQINQVVLDAYEIRMNGNAEKAADMLKKYIEKDSSNAMVYFEYARALCHLSPEQIEFNRAERKTINHTDTVKRMQALDAIDRAIKLDPWNYYYQSLEGNILESLKDKYSREEKRVQYEQMNYVMEKSFEIKPSVELATGLFYYYAYKSMNDSVKASQKGEKYMEYLKENKTEDKYIDFKNSGGKLSRFDYYWQLLASDSLNVDILKILGSICFEQDSVEQGIECYEKALKISGDYQHVLGFLWLNPSAESQSFGHNLNAESRETLDEWKIEKIMAFLETNPNAPTTCLSYMSLSNIYKRRGEEEKAREMDLMARKTDRYFYKLGHYDEGLLRNPLEVFEYCNLGENLSK